MKNVTKCHLSQFYQWNKNQKSKRLNKSEYRGRIQPFRRQQAPEVPQKIQGKCFDPAKFTRPKPISTQNDSNQFSVPMMTQYTRCRYRSD